MNVTSLKVGIGESICRNKISLYEINYMELTEKSMDVINLFLNPRDLMIDIHGHNITLIQSVLILDGFRLMKPIIKEIMDFNFALLIHLQNLLESKRRFADQKISIIIAVSAILIAIISAII